MINVKVEVLDAIVDGQGRGAVIVVEAKAAQHLAKIGYVRVIEEKAEPKTDKPEKVEPETKTAKPKRGK